MAPLAHAVAGQGQHAREAREPDGDDGGGHEHFHKAEAAVASCHGVMLTRPVGATTTLRVRPFFDTV